MLNWERRISSPSESIMPTIYVPATHATLLEIAGVLTQLPRGDGACRGLPRN